MFNARIRVIFALLQQYAMSVYKIITFNLINHVRIHAPLGIMLKMVLAKAALNFVILAQINKHALSVCILIWFITIFVLRNVQLDIMQAPILAKNVMILVKLALDLKSINAKLVSTIMHLFKEGRLGSAFAIKHF